MGLIFGNVDFADYGVIADGEKTWAKPVRDRTLVHVPGRNGDLILDNGCWQNIEVKYNCLIKDDWKTNFTEFCKAIFNQHGYYSLYDDNHPGVYRMAEFAGGLNPDLIFTTDEGVFEITFNCKPQLFISGVPDMEFDFTSANDTEYVDNEYGMDAYPLIIVDGASNGAEFYVFGGGTNEWNIKIAPNSYDRIRIDCELETCTAYDADDFPVANANSLVTITPGADTESDRDFPFFFPTTGLYVTAYHSRGGSTYTGTATVRPRFTRI